MNHVYVLPGLVDEQKMRERVEQRYIQEGVAAVVHKHTDVEACSRLCYVWPKTWSDEGV